MKKCVSLYLVFVLLLFNLPSLAEHGELSYGSQGEDVRALQERLKELGYYFISVYEDYGNGTK